MVEIGETIASLLCKEQWLSIPIDSSNINILCDPYLIEFNTVHYFCGERKKKFFIQTFAF